MVNIGWMSVKWGSVPEGGEMVTESLDLSLVGLERAGTAIVSNF